MALSAEAARRHHPCPTKPSGTRVGLALLIGALTLAATPDGSAAQGLEVGAFRSVLGPTRERSAGKVVPDALHGVALRWAFRSPRLDVRLDGVFGGESADGSVCAGLIPAGECVSESVRYTARLWAATVGTWTDVPLGEAWFLPLRVRAGWSRATAVERGEDTGARLEDSTAGVVVGFDVGLGRASPWGAPFSLVALAGVDSMLTPSLERCADCHEAFNRRFERFSLGLAVAGRWF